MYTNASVQKTPKKRKASDDDYNEVSVKDKEHPVRRHRDQPQSRQDMDSSNKRVREW